MNESSDNGSRASGAVPDKPAIVVENLCKTYRLGRPTPSSPAALRNWGRRAATRLLPGLRDESRQGLASEFKDPGPLRLIPALRDVSFEVAKGAALGIAGPVGSGKSTLLKVLNRTSPPSSGRVVINGRVAPSLELAPTFLDEDLTGRENCYRLAQLFGVPRTVVDRRAEDIFAFAELSAKSDVTARTYSSGEYRRLGFSIALNLESDILVADERVLAGDSTFAEHVRWRIARASHEEGLTLLLESNDLEVLQEFCSEVIWMDEGQIVDRIPAAGIADAAVDLRVRARNKQSNSEPAPILDASRSEPLQLLLNQGQTYADAARVMDETEAEVRDLAHAAVRLIGPPSVDLTADRRGELIDYLLNQQTPSGTEETQARLSKAPRERAWAQTVADCLTGVGYPTPVEIPTGHSTTTSTPSLDPAAAALLKFVRAGQGHERADHSLKRATELAIRKRQTSVKWLQMAVAAGLDHEEAKGIVTRMLEAEEGESGASRKRRIFNEHVAIMSVEALTGEGDAAETIRIDEPVTIRIGLEVAATDLYVGISVALTCKHGDPVRLEHPEHFSIPRPGTYRVSVHVPPGTFGEDVYHGRVIVRTKQGRTKGTVKGPAGLELAVYDPRDEDEKDDAEDGVSAFPPDVRWSVTMLEATS